MTDPKICVNCWHWGGDRLSIALTVEKYGLRVLSRDRCSVSAEECSEIKNNGIEVEIDDSGYGGYGTVTLETEPWFGCNQWKEMK